SLQIYLEEIETVTVYCSKCNFQYLDVSLVQIRNWNIYSCSPHTQCVSSAGTVAHFNDSGSYFSIVFSDIKIRRSITGVKCVFKNTTNDNYTYYEDVTIIAKPENISCFDTQVINSSANISITCRTAKSYPAALCSLNMQEQ
ncbi:hypothetical protein BgiMline_031147, partial [Biomphalaria glabrata]